MPHLVSFWNPPGPGIGVAMVTAARLRVRVRMVDGKYMLSWRGFMRMRADDHWK